MLDSQNHRSSILKEGLRLEADRATYDPAGSDSLSVPASAILRPLIL